MQTLLLCQVKTSVYIKTSVIEVLTFLGSLYLKLSIAVNLSLELNTSTKVAKVLRITLTQILLLFNMRKCVYIINPGIEVLVFLESLYLKLHIEVNLNSLCNSRTGIRQILGINLT